MGRAYTSPLTKVNKMINNPAKRLDEIEIEVKKLNQEANDIKDINLPRTFKGAR
jgi:hypothetical protein